MATRGPKPKQKAAIVPGPMPEPPDWMTSPRALNVWHEYGPTLNALGLLESLDALAFSLLCDGLDALLEAREELSGQNLVVEVGEHGSPIQNPLVSIVRQQVKTVHDLLTEFAMTPGGRIRLTGSTSVKADQQTKDPLEALAERMGQMVSETIPAESRPAKAAAKKKPAKRKPRK
jgi:P27 family predicted phage terminase small subunit